MVAALTYNRPDGLAALLDAWTRIIAPADAAFLVVDNSPDGNARAAVEATAASGAIDLRYVHEPAPGISIARNRALKEAAALGGGLLAFIDDDEVPSQEWLPRLLETRARTSAEAVLGKVTARLPDGAPAWIARAGYFDIDGEEGVDVAHGATCNALIDLAFVQRCGLEFDPAFGRSGAEDTWFFRRMRTLGGKVVFSKGALVHDIIPTSRARLDWLRARWRRTGNTDARIKVREGASRLRIWISGAVRVALGGLIAAAGLVPAAAGRFDLCARGIRVLERGVGHIAAATGRTVIEYRKDADAASDATAA